MAAQTTPIDGSYYRVEFSTDGGTTLAELGYQKESGLQISTEFREITSKAQCNWREKVPTVSNWTISGTAEFYNNDATDVVYDDLLAELRTVDRLKITAVDCSGVAISGETEYEGAGFFSQLDVSFPEKDTATYSYTWEGSGALTATPIA